VAQRPEEQGLYTAGSDAAVDAGAWSVTALSQHDRALRLIGELGIGACEPIVRAPARSRIAGPVMPTDSFECCGEGAALAGIEGVERCAGRGVARLESGTLCVAGATGAQGLEHASVQGAEVA